MDEMKKANFFYPLIILILISGSSALDQPVPPAGVQAKDNPGDGGNKMLITWKTVKAPGLSGYDIFRQAESDTWTKLIFLGRMAHKYVDDAVSNSIRYRYKVSAVYPSGKLESAPTDWITSSAQWFNPATLPAVIGTIVFTSLILFFITRARRGMKLFIRRIAGLDAVEEALGRATEMGRSVLFVPGLSTIDDIATIAALNIMGEVAKKTAKFGTPLIVPVADPIVYTVAQQTVKESYTTAGRPDAFNQNMVYFVTNQQFAFAAAVDGIIVREKPATNFFIGMFWAESLILAETGATTGAVQIAGTDAIAQLPFFITACDYTLIGEELYAASAYLSREPLLLGSIKGQDYAKLAIVIFLVVATILALAARLPTPNWL
ncbi:hypothetical protein CH330_08555 [candidate division WOR-3 bacterium JGI_Cruoil_03_51_56]|uniref:Fibronectin type-III domain-containing protein n=1 Tax=candidate division WOR-3 bacterium JGI_Cruoil_03_51_56 TaxID=1973747 RepID=A0A235BPS4_UNCW3|nr:MAG: hypothetical protein CH330_08555 [candidate division WOR-3 bacterium JGI_Cruoil_03_51_56]